MTLSLDVNDVTIDELCLLEEVLGDDVIADVMEGKVRPKALRGLVWLSLRRTNPDATIEEAGAVRVADLPGAPAADG